MSQSPRDTLGMESAITRRDFVNGALVGTGAALTLGGGVANAAAAPAPYAPSGSPWTGYGGVGDYRWSNGNTEAVIEAAHGIRDRSYPDAAAQAFDEEVDLLVVGGGFSGMTAAYEFTRRAHAGQTCLLLENHPIMGGEAKQNEFVVNGRRLTAPQGSNGGLIIKDGFDKAGFDGGRYDVYTDIYRDLAIPTAFELERLAGGAERYNISDYHFAAMAPQSESGFALGYHFPGHGWAKNPHQAKFANTPWPVAVQKEMDDFVNNRRDLVSATRDVDHWLDSITYHDLLDKLGYGATVKQFVDPYIAVANFGVSGSAISAYAAKRLYLPGTTPTIPTPQTERQKKDNENIGVVSFPGGNAAFLRMMLARMIPGSIGGDGSIAATASSSVDFATLDRAGAPLRIRLSSTVIDVRHDGDPATSGHVLVTYARDGKIRRVRARSVVMASGGWVNRNIVTDMPEALTAAYGAFHYGPVMTANVALTNWRFFDTLGLTVARWFEGLGWHVGMRRNVAFGSNRPLTPDDPTVLTFYIPFLEPELPASMQGAAARARLLATSYAEFEHQIRTQMTEMFGPAGFDARRDIAGIVLNRWGHAFVAPQPGWYLGRNGGTPPHEVVRRGHGRIFFGHSELQGTMAMAMAMREAHRAAGQAMAML
ncbi:MAG: NAD(P)-binding protein [Pseudomonadota bacterium]